MMNVNSFKFATMLALAGTFLFSPLPAQASHIVPSLYKVEDFVVDLTRFNDERKANTCGLFRRDVTDLVLEKMKRDGLPARASLGRDVTDDSKVSVDIVPQIITIKPKEKQCTSWIKLSAQTRNAINLPPATYHREVRLIYWDGGILVHTTEHAHGRSVGEALEKLIDQLVIRYETDQPPTLEKK